MLSSATEPVLSACGGGSGPEGGGEPSKRQEGTEQHQHAGAVAQAVPTAVRETSESGTVRISLLVSAPGDLLGGMRMPGLMGGPPSREVTLTMPGISPSSSSVLPLSSPNIEHLDEQESDGATVERYRGILTRKAWRPRSALTRLWSV